VSIFTPSVQSSDWLVPHVQMLVLLYENMTVLCPCKHLDFCYKCKLSDFYFIAILNSSFTNNSDILLILINATLEGSIINQLLISV
jgi:hypothetical protein